MVSTERFALVARAARDGFRHGVGTPSMLVVSAVAVVVCGGLLVVTVPLVVVPLVGIVLGLLVRALVVPATLAGLVATAVAALEGDRSGDTPGAGGLRAFPTAARRHLRAIGGAGVTRFAVDVGLVGVSVTTVYVAAVGLALSDAAGGGASVAAAVYGFGLGLAVIALGYGVGVVCFQFVDTAVVIGGADTTDAFRESVRLLRAAPGTVLTYTFARLLPGVAAVAVLRLVAWPLVRPTVETATVETGRVAAAGVITLLVATVVVAFSVVFHVSVYRRLAPPRDAADSPTDSPGTEHPTETNDVTPTDDRWA
ncbi:hypothetical protein RYH80_12155 [Halobaculum sp. MBLA0147]|uniref:DUF7847 domain-containing protein n=1 Tax=Halobaculum sp. MBLA0147 TaxID=3079934 RepID=UPI003524EC47